MSFHDLSSRTDFTLPPKPKRVPRISSRVGGLLLVCSLPAQKIHVVDASGNAGQYKTITATVNAASDSDQIFVKKGVYAEFVVLNGKAVNALGIAPNVNVSNADRKSNPGEILKKERSVGLVEGKEEDVVEVGRQRVSAEGVSR